MTLRIGGTRVRAHPLALLFPLAAAMLGVRGDAAALLAALAAHEGAHLLAARWMRIGVSQIRLMPFGGAIRMENPYALPAGRLAAVAAAGPLGNLALLVACAALAHWGTLSPVAALAALKANLLLMLFNLLPALPLDGGRMLVAWLSPRLGTARAVGIGIAVGRAVAAALLALCAWTGVARGRFNLSLALCAVFMLASAADERRAADDARARTLLNALKPPAGPARVRLLAVDGGCPAREALRFADPGAPTLFAVYAGGALRGFTDDRALLETALSPGGGRVADACRAAPPLAPRASAC